MSVFICAAGGLIYQSTLNDMTCPACLLAIQPVRMVTEWFSLDNGWIFYSSLHEFLFSCASNFHFRETESRRQQNTVAIIPLLLDVVVLFFPLFLLLGTLRTRTEVWSSIILIMIHTDKILKYYFCHHRPLRIRHRPSWKITRKPSLVMAHADGREAEWSVRNSYFFNNKEAMKMVFHCVHTISSVYVYLLYAILLEKNI